VITAWTNAVNLTDGLDGLAIGLTGIAAAALAAFAYVIGRADWSEYLQILHLPGSGELTIYCLALVGAALGFLWFNAHPAQVFMGDTGSLAIGGVIAGLALLTNTNLLLPILGGLFVVETLSVIAQVIAFRGFKRRVLRMAPIHHHYEVLGWHEFTVIVRFWLFAGLCVALGLGLFYADFIRIPGAID
jgi:phospho-N-acetylmuramoyl-pentapeptide-transferase